MPTRLRGLIAIRWNESKRCTLFSEISTNDDIDVKTMVCVLLLIYLINFVRHEEGVRKVLLSQLKPMKSVRITDWALCGRLIELEFSVVHALKRRINVQHAVYNPTKITVVGYRNDEGGIPDFKIVVYHYAEEPGIRRIVHR